MANSDFLRLNKNQHSIKNSISKRMDKDIDKAIKIVIKGLKEKYPHLEFEHLSRLHLEEIINMLRAQFQSFSERFSVVRATSFIKPDGGFLYASYKGKRHIILAAEVKRQGTNDKRAKEGLPKQAQGNAIERLGKNVIGIRAIFKTEKIIPFVCFGSGNDFTENSSILDRVRTINEFFPLNKFFVEKDHSPFEPVSMFFRYEDWSVDEMAHIMIKVAETSIVHYKL